MSVGVLVIAIVICRSCSTDWRKRRHSEPIEARVFRLRTYGWVERGRGSTQIEIFSLRADRTELLSKQKGDRRKTR